MASHPMHRFMELGDGGDEFDRSCGLDLLWLVLLHPLEEIDKPLTGNVIANEEYTDHDDVEDDSKDPLHIQVPRKESMLQSRT